MIALAPYLHEFNRSWITRASAIFWAVVDDDIDTSVELLNYWALKHGARDVLVSAELRDLLGALIARRAFPLTEVRAYRIEARDLLSEAGASAPFEGCLDIEIVADVDIHFAYPAMMALYRGKRWQALVHTYCRSYAARSGDTPEDLTECRMTEESNWFIHGPEANDLFLVLHNGPHAAPKDRLALTLFSAAGDRLALDVALPARAPHATTRIEPGRHADIAGFLGDQDGFGVARFAARGVLPRLLVGYRTATGALLNMTHSHIDSSKDAARFDIEKPAPDRPMFISVPIGAALPWRTSLILYPTTAPADYELEWRWLDADGAPLGQQSAPFATGGDTRVMTILPLDEDAPARAAVADVALVPRESWVPTRFHLGVLFKGEGGAIAAPTTGFATLRKPRYGTYWTPVTRLPDRDETVMIVNTDTARAGGGACKLALTLFRSTDDATLSGALTLAANASYIGGVDELVPGAARFLGEGPGWLVMRPREKANLHVFFAVRHRDSNWLASDHGF